MQRVLWIIYFSMCFFDIGQVSGIRPREGLCVIAAIVIQSSCHPADYEGPDDYEYVDSKLELPQTTQELERMPVIPTTVKFSTPRNEWRLRGEYRIQCVEDMGIPAAKVINLLNGGNWEVEDNELKRWALCVLNKMDLMSMEGVFRLDVALSKVNSTDRAEVETLVDHCLPDKPLRPAEIAWKYVKCHNSLGSHFKSISVF